MGKLADALDKAGYGEEDFLSVEKEAICNNRGNRSRSLRKHNEEQLPEIEYPDEIEIETPEIPEPELQMEAPSPAKTPEARSTEREFSSKACFNQVTINSFDRCLG